MRSNKTYSVSISEVDIRDRLDTYCRERGITRSAMLRMLISRFMQELRDTEAEWESENALTGQSN